MSPLNIILPGWTMLPTAIPDEPLTETPPVDENPTWSPSAANDDAEPRYFDYCYKQVRRFATGRPLRSVRMALRRHGSRRLTQ